MGIPLFSKSSYDEPKKYSNEAYTDLEKAPKNPDPSKFSIMIHQPVGDYLIVMVKYHDVTNYEGTKVLVFKDLSIEELRKFRTIDPHFSESTKFKSPIARFVPTVEGWDMAIHFCLMMIK